MLSEHVPCMVLQYMYIVHDIAINVHGIAIHVDDIAITFKCHLQSGQAVQNLSLALFWDTPTIPLISIFLCS